LLEQRGIDRLVVPELNARDAAHACGGPPDAAGALEWAPGMFIR
jgi:hypothetical protein